MPHADNDVLILLSGIDSAICDRATNALYTRPADSSAWPTRNNGALAFAGGTKYMQLAHPALYAPLRASTGFSAAFTFTLDSFPGGGEDAQMLLLQGASGAAMHVRIATAAQRLEFRVELAGGGGVFTAASADGAVVLGTALTAAVRFVKETGEMEVWLGGADDTQTSVAALVRTMITAAC